MSKVKRRLSEEEIEQAKEWLGREPKRSVRMIARHFGVSQPAVIKSLNLWEGIQRNVPQPMNAPFGLPIISGASPVSIEPYTTEVNVK